MSFKERLRYMREKVGYTSAKGFATTLGIPYQTYLNYENKGTEPKYDTLCQIATALNCTQCLKGGLCSELDCLLGHSWDAPSVSIAQSVIFG